MWTKIKSMWAKFKNWVKKNWLFVLNPVVIAIVYSIISDKGFEVVELLLGLTLFLNITYWVYTIWGPKKKVVQ